VTAAGISIGGGGVALGSRRLPEKAVMAESGENVRMVSAAWRGHLPGVNLAKYRTGE